jgi:hypothetical protein
VQQSQQPELGRGTLMPANDELRGLAVGVPQLERGRSARHATGQLPGTKQLTSGRDLLGDSLEAQSFTGA